MTDSIEEMAGPELEEVMIALNSLYLCIELVMKHVAQNESDQAAVNLKSSLLEALKGGDIDMALLEEAKTFHLVVSKIEQLSVG